MARDSSKFEDKGFLGPNQYAKRDTHPSHTGIVALSPKTLKELNRRYQDGEPVELEISGWRKTDNPKQLSLKIQPKFKKDDEEPRRSSKRRDDYEDDEAPRRSSRRRDEEDLEDEIPFEDRRSSGRRSRDRDYGDDGDL